MEAISCEKASLYASKSLEQKLSFREKLVFYLHQVVCPACRLFRRQIIFIECCRKQMWSDGKFSKHSLSKEECQRMQEKLNQMILQEKEERGGEKKNVN